MRAAIVSNTVCQSLLDESLGELALGFLTLLVALISLALLPIALVVATPFILLWPMGEKPRGATIRARYARVRKAVFFIWEIVAAAII